MFEIWIPDICLRPDVQIQLINPHSLPDYQNQQQVTMHELPASARELHGNLAKSHYN
jgi:hypothetical protein